MKYKTILVSKNSILNSTKADKYWQYDQIIQDRCFTHRDHQICPLCPALTLKVACFVFLHIMNWMYFSMCDSPYLIFVIFFTQSKFLENEIYTEKTRILRQNTQKIANFLLYYGKIHSKLPIFRVKSVKIYTGQKKFTRACSWRSWQISGMVKVWGLLLGIPTL